tara:strand:+ start:219 stop:863 length:645 start_codon:yes stop_codon:yes gene_type:complete
MNEDLSIINANTRNEKIKNFVLNHKIKIISGIIILIIAIIVAFSYDKYLNDKKKEISDNFNSITIEYTEKNSEKTARSLIEVINKKDPTYSPLSLYFIIDNNLVSDTKLVNSLFDILIIDTKLDNEIKNLIIYKKALYNADKVTESDLLSILKPIINSKSVWKSHAMYLIGEYFYAKNEKQKAKEFFNQIISLEDSNANIRLQAEKRINRDLGE